MGDVLHALPAVCHVGRALARGAQSAWVIEQRWREAVVRPPESSIGGSAGAGRPLVDTALNEPASTSTRDCRAGGFTTEPPSALVRSPNLCLETPDAWLISPSRDPQTE